MTIPNAKSIAAFREAGEREKILHRLIEEDRHIVPHNPTPSPKPLKQTCDGCGLSKSIFATCTEFLTHKQICTGGTTE